MGCGLSKSSDSDSPQQKRRRGSKRRGSVSASDASTDDASPGVDVANDAKKNKARAPVTATPVLNQTKVLSASQQDFFRELDQKIEQGRDLDPVQAEQETRLRMELLLRHWDEVIHSRPGTTRPRPNSLASTFSHSLVGNGSAQRAAPLPPPSEGTEDSRDATRLERNVRSSRRSMRSTRADSTEDAAPAAAAVAAAAAAAAAAGATAAPERPQLDDSQLVTKLIQLGDAYVHDLNADDPDRFVRLGRRSSNYEEPAIMEESEAAHARGEYGKSSLVLRTVLDDAVR